MRNRDHYLAERHVVPLDNMAWIEIEHWVPASTGGAKRLEAFIERWLCQLGHDIKVKRVLCRQEDHQ